MAPPPAPAPASTVPPGEYRLRLPGTARPVTLEVSRNGAGTALLWCDNRWVGCLTSGGRYEGYAWAREALAAIPAHGQRISRCQDCHRELTDPESIARGIGPDCWAARSERRTA